MNRIIIDLESNLINFGFELIESIDDWGYILKGEKYRIRVLLENNLIQFGFNSTFDRWANSVDHEESIPRNGKKVIKVLDYVSKMIKCSSVLIGDQKVILILQVTDPFVTGVVVNVIKEKINNYDKNVYNNNK